MDTWKFEEGEAHKKLMMYNADKLGRSWNPFYNVTKDAVQSNNYEVIYILHKHLPESMLKNTGSLMGRNASIEMLEFITTMDASVTKTWGANPMLRRENVGNIRYLLRQGMDFSASLTPLSLALLKDDMDKVRDICKNTPQAVKQKDKCYTYPICWVSSVEQLDLLLEAGADLSVSTSTTPLYRAVTTRNTELVEKLILMGEKVNANVYPSNWIPTGIMSIAAAQGDKPMAELLLKYGANVNASLSSPTSTFPTPFAAAVMRGHTDMADLLLEHGAVIKPQLTSYFLLRNNKHALEYLLKKVDIHKTDVHGDTLLHEAVKINNPDMVSFLLDQGAEVDSQNADGCTPLYYAAARNYSAIAQILLDEGADMFVKNKQEYTPADRSISSADMLRLFMKNGLDAEDKVRINGAKASLLPTFLQLGMAEEAEELLDTVNLTETDGCGDTQLHSAAIRGMKDIVEKLIKMGASTTAANNNGNTPLHYAAKKGHLDICKLLLKHGAKATTANKFKRTPLHFAALSGNGELFSLLEKHGAKATDVCTAGNTCLHYAARGGNAILVEYLLGEGLSPNEANNDGVTPLLAAASSPNKEILKLLVDKGGNINLTNKEGENLAKLLSHHRGQDFSDILKRAEKAETATKKEKLTSWSPDNISTEWTELKLSRPASFFKQCSAIEFKYTSGNARLDIQKIAFSVDGKTVVEIQNPGFAGIPSENNICALQQKLNRLQDSADCCIHLYIKAHENNDSYGDIILHTTGDSAPASNKLFSWSPDNISTEWTDMSFTRPASFFKQYKSVLFKYTSGNARLDIQKVAFSVDEKIVAEIKHDGYAGIPSHNNVYHFQNALNKVKDNQTCRIHLFIKAHEVNDSNGDIILQK